MNKIFTYIKYFKDFIKHGEFRYIFSSIRYVLTRKTTRKTRYYKSSLGKFLVRQGTLDFQFANYAYEWEVKKFMYSNYMNYNVFLDIGANIGTYSILLAQKGLKGFAFEPVKSNFNATNTNLELNGLVDKVKVYPVALGDHKHEVQFVYDPVNTGASHLAANSSFLEEVVGGKDLTVEVVALDSLIPEMEIKKEDKILIKMDVEGMESEVLNGAKKFMSEYPNILITLESVHSGGEKLKEILDSCGEFEYVEIDHLNMAAKKIN